MTLFRVYRGTRDGGALHDYQVAAGEGMVVLDAVHAIQAEQAPDLAVRWNCKAGKCGSCSAEINGRPRLMCMTRMSDYPADQTITVMPMKAFPVIKDLVTDVSWNYEVNKRIPAFQPRAPDAAEGTWRMYQYEVERPRNSASASSASCARTYVTCCARTRSTPSSWAPRFSCAPRCTRCTRSTRRTAGRISAKREGSATATSPSVAPRSVPSRSRSRTTRSSRSRSGWRTRTTIRWRP